MPTNKNFVKKNSKFCSWWPGATVEKPTEFGDVFKILNFALKKILVPAANGPAGAREPKIFFARNLKI